MRNSKAPARVLVLSLVALVAWAREAGAQQQAQGFAVDRLYLSAPGGGWFVMDTLDMHGGLGGALSLTTDYAHNPLRVRSSNGSERLTVVSDEALARFGFAATYDRFRAYLNFDMPLAVNGQSGTVGAYPFTSPSAAQPFTPSGVNPATATDALADARIGLDARLHGTDRSPLRVGASAQLFVPSPNTPRAEYLTDNTFRAMGRILFAGDDSEIFTYAGHLGVHFRPLDDSPIPGSPQGSELLFGLALGRRFPLYDRGNRVFVIGPEFYGATAFRSFFSSDATALEGLLTGRLEGTAEGGPQVRIKLGAGGGISRHFGAPEWRLALAVEVFGRNSK